MTGLLQAGSHRDFWVTLDEGPSAAPSCCCSYQCFSQSSDEWEPPVSLLVLLKGKPNDLPRRHHRHLFIISRAPNFAYIFFPYPVVSPVYTAVPFTPFSDTKDQSPMFIQQLLAVVPLLWVKQRAFAELHSTLWSRSMKISYYSQRVLFTGEKNRSNPACNAVTVGCGRKDVIVVCAKHKSKQDHK